MDYEYRALEWTTVSSGEDTEFVAEKQRLLDQGWQTEILALFHPKRVGGVCIMRRPKDEPRMWTEGEIKRVARDGLLCMDALMREAIQEIVRTTPAVTYATE